MYNEPVGGREKGPQLAVRKMNHAYINNGADHPGVGRPGLHLLKTHVC